MSKKTTNVSFVERDSSVEAANGTFVADFKKHEPCAERAWLMFFLPRAYALSSIEYKFFFRAKLLRTPIIFSISITLVVFRANLGRRKIYNSPNSQGCPWKERNSLPNFAYLQEIEKL